MPPALSAGGAGSAGAAGQEEQTSEVSSPETLSDGPGLKEILKGGEGNQMWPQDRQNLMLLI